MCPNAAIDARANRLYALAWFHPWGQPTLGLVSVQLQPPRVGPSEKGPQISPTKVISVQEAVRTGLCLSQSCRRF